MSFLIGVILSLSAPAGPAQPQLALNAVHPYGDEASETPAVFSAVVTLPSNVIMPGAYQDLVDEMLRRSPTFRAQCTRIGLAPQLRVAVQRSLFAPPQAARTQLLRREAGRVEAIVEIGLFGDAAMLIAHEFEHIIEQLDGVDLASMADRQGTGVRIDPTNGQFETERAITMGRRVAREVSRAVARR